MRGKVVGGSRERSSRMRWRVWDASSSSSSSLSTEEGRFDASMLFC